MENRQRQIAHKIQISEILNGVYVKEEGWIPNYFIVNNEKISRANIVGVIVAKTEKEERKEILIDDKTGRISVRSFNDPTIFKGVNIGDVVLLIGRPREYSGEKYIVPEIIRGVGVSWFELRLVELNTNSKIKGKKEDEDRVVMVDGVVNKITQSKITSDEVLNLIKRLDGGGGVNYEELVEKVGNESVLKRLLEEGEIFEITPGKLKVL